MWNRQLVRVLCLGVFALGLTACDHDDDDTPPPPAGDIGVPAQNTIGGTVTGSTGSLTLQNSTGDTLIVPASGPFTFPTRVQNGGAYSVTMGAPPNSQTCTVANGAGTTFGNVTNVAVTCTTNVFSIGGTISGLGAGRSVVLRVLSDFTQGSLTVSANGTFTFPVTFVNNAEFEVIVFTQPVGQTCSVVRGAGDITNANVTNVEITCIDSSASARNWTAPASLVVDTDVQDPNFMDSPEVAFDAAGNAIAVWRADNVGAQGENIIWSRKLVGGNWSTPAPLPLHFSTNPPFPALPTPEYRRDPRLAVAANGNAVVVWRQGPNMGGWDVMASFYTAGGGWSDPEYVWQKHIDAPSGADSISVRMDAANNTLVVWEASQFIQYNRHTPGSGWVNPPNGVGSLVSPIQQNALRPSMALNAAGQAVAIWKKSDIVLQPTHFDMWARTYDMATNTWGTAVEIESDDSGSVYFENSVVIDSVGNAMAFWTQRDGERLHVMANRLTGNTWGTAAAVETGNTGTVENAFDVHAVIDGTGNVTAVWLQYDNDEGHYVANRHVPGTGWGTQENIGQYVTVGSTILDTEIVLAGNAAGHVVALWSFPGGVGEENVPFPNNIYANEFNPANGNWGSPEFIDKDGDENDYALGSATSPHVAVDASGNAIAVWDTDTSATFDGIREARFE